MTAVRSFARAVLVGMCCAPAPLRAHERASVPAAGPEAVPDVALRGLWTELQLGAGWAW